MNTLNCYCKNAKCTKTKKRIFFFVFKIKYNYTKLKEKKLLESFFDSFLQNGGRKKDKDKEEEWIVVECLESKKKIQLSHEFNLVLFFPPFILHIIYSLINW